MHFVEETPSVAPTYSLKKETDGSLTILLQRDEPTGTSEGILAPTGDLNHPMRLCGLETPILDGSYRLPAVQPIQ
jgi:hypothetical protein